jgi:hypothetical protein
MKTSIAFLLLLASFIGCSHQHSRSPSSTYDAEGPIVNYEATIDIPRSTEGNIKYVMVRGRFAYNIDKEFKRSSSREYLPKDKVAIKDHFNISSNESWSASVKPSGYVVPKVEIDKTEGLTCFMTIQGFLLQNDTDPKSMKYDEALKYHLAYKLFDSQDNKKMIAPYDEINGLDAVICAYQGEKESLSINVKYSFLAPEAAQFSEKYKQDILNIYYPYKKKGSFSFEENNISRNVENDLPFSDLFMLGDNRIEKVKSIYEKFKTQNFILNNEIKDSVGATLGLHGKNQQIQMKSKKDFDNEVMGTVHKGSLVVLLPGGSLMMKRGAFWYNAILAQHQEVTGVKKFFVGKKSNYERSDVDPFSFYCSIDGQIVYNSKDATHFQFTAPKDGTLSCGVNIDKKISKFRGDINVNLMIYDSEDLKVMLESFIHDEDNFVEDYSKELANARINSIKSWLEKVSPKQ